MSFPLCLILGACVPVQVPREEAAQVGSGYWPADSRMAVNEAFDALLPGLQLDVQFTADDVPVLHAGPDFDGADCNVKNEPAADEPVPIRTLLAADVANWRCGVRPDPEHPDAEVKPQAPLTFDDFLVLLRDAPNDLIVHVDVPGEPSLTPELAAEAVLDRWYTADLPNPFYTSTADQALVAALEAQGRVWGDDPYVALQWDPSLPEDVAYDVDAIGVDADWADTEEITWMRSVGVPVQVWVGPSQAARDHFLARSFDAVITDYPGVDP